MKPFALNKLLLASGNAGKFKELQAVLQPLGIELSAQPQTPEFEVAETGSTFVENAIIKARHAAVLTGQPVLADDSGLIVDALAGRPGVHTSRFAGEDATSADNIALLLKKLEGLHANQRSARFASVIVLLRHADDPLPLVASGIWQGRISEQPAGVGGFGYDPVFFVPEFGCTAAELDPDIKHRVSHRGQAIAALLQQLQKESTDRTGSMPAGCNHA